MLIRQDLVNGLNGIPVKRTDAVTVPESDCVSVRVASQDMRSAVQKARMLKKKTATVSERNQRVLLRLERRKCLALLGVDGEPGAGVQDLVALE